MNSRFRASLAAAALSLTIAGCAGPMIGYYQLSDLNKGMTPEATQSVLKQTPLSMHTVTMNGTKYEFQRYRLSTAVSVDLYLLAFENGGLKYWGYIDEFRRYPDKNLNQAFDAALPEIRASVR